MIVLIFSTLFLYGGVVYKTVIKTQPINKNPFKIPYGFKLKIIANTS
ncbi:MAG: hypothetical protein WBB37_10035 [bacterium]